MHRWLAIAGFVAAVCSSAAQASYVALVEIDGAIGPASSAHFEKAHARAVDGGAQALVLRIDTPGGLDSAMRDIIRGILASPIPVIGWVGPGGARAASAGTYILYATHLAAMAPATNLGAATPVPVGGSWPLPGARDERREPGEDGDTKTAEPPHDAGQAKVINDAVAYIRGLAEQRGRNTDWAESAVREGASLSASQAQAQNVVELIAADVAELLQAADGRRVHTAAGEQTLRTAGLRVETIEADWRIRLLSVLTNPTVAYVLMLIGIYGLLLEGYSPGALVPGIVGAISLLLALYAFQMLPVNYVGLALILLGVALMVAEALAPSLGVLGIGGAVAFVFGSILLMDADVPGYAVNLGVIAGIAVSAVALLGITLFLLWRARRAPVVTGDGGFAGQHAVALEAFESEGWVEFAGERWRVRTTHPLTKGQRVRVIRRDGLWLEVEPVN
ncbi:NfeD family protein [Sinimarinibacterium thermocellulolyticum]|uniref:Nodulation protein NfeD n=1 Tax=Sinimarinibacterium thermocellulolyticum TaxID=3170016 RepID=A0ABV2A9J0_9GAMM